MRVKGCTKPKGEMKVRSGPRMRPWADPWAGRRRRGPVAVMRGELLSLANVGRALERGQKVPRCGRRPGTCQDAVVPIWWAVVGKYLEQTCWDPKDGELCLARTKPGEILVEVRSNSDVQIDCQSWV